MIRSALLALIATVVLAQSTLSRVVITFTPNPANPTGVTRNIYRANAPCSATPAPTFVKINATPFAATTYTDSVPIGQYCYYSKVVAGGLESIPSNTVEHSAAPLPETITLTVPIAINITKDGAIIRAQLVEAGPLPGKNP